MADLISPGVYISEYDQSQIVPTVSNSVGVFGGNFLKGPIGTFSFVTSTAVLEEIYGKPTDSNYNDWYQASNFLQYGNKLFISRACNTDGTTSQVKKEVTLVDIEADTTNKVTVTNIKNFERGMILVFGADKETYVLTELDTQTPAITLNKNIETDVPVNTPINNISMARSAQNESYDSLSDVMAPVKIDGFEIAENGVKIGDEAFDLELDLLKNFTNIFSKTDFENKYPMLAITKDSKFKFFAQNPGTWGNDIEIAIAPAKAFIDGKAQAFSGVSLNGMFEYNPLGDQIGIIIRLGSVVEVYTVSLDKNEKDYNGRSIYIENKINSESSIVYVKHNTSNTDPVLPRLTETILEESQQPIKLRLGEDAPITVGSLADAYGVWDNIEEVDVDIVIANELDYGVSAKNLAETRQDCIAFIGVDYARVVGLSRTKCVENVIKARNSGEYNYSSMFCVFTAQYKNQYDKYTDTYRWVNIAGDIAGLRAQTTTNRASWWASAGLERGQIANVNKLAFNPTQADRDEMYKVGINPVCAFPGQGYVMWGQKTLLSVPSSFDRVNVRGLFNTIERALRKMSMGQVMEFNDNFTRNKITAMIKPYLATVKSGRGIEDSLVVCDRSNNTDDVISRNQLVVDVYIKPTYVAEIIHLKFTNAGTNSFSSVVQSA